MKPSLLALTCSLWTGAFFGMAAMPSADAAEPGWINLLENNSLDQWTTVGQAPVSAGWKVESGVLHRASRGGDIITKAEFGDCDLRWEWKLAAGGNSGLKYKVRSYGSSWLGLEYQLLDDIKHPDAEAREGRRKTAAVYDLFPCNDAKQLHPVGEWNESRVVIRGTKVEHWLNGARVVSFEIGGPDWDKAYAASKFSQTEGFARNKLGRILLQDHGDAVWIRNLRIRALED